MKSRLTVYLTARDTYITRHLYGIAAFTRMTENPDMHITDHLLFERVREDFPMILFHVMCFVHRKLDFLSCIQNVFRAWGAKCAPREIA